jgi:hypothetical protein
LAFGVQVAVVGLGRLIVPATSMFAAFAWTMTDDAVTPVTGSEKEIENGPVSGASVVGVWPEMNGTVESIVQTCSN